MSRALRVQYAAAFVVSCALGLGHAPTRAQIDRADLIRVAPSVIKIEAIGVNSRLQLGSGVIVGSGKVVTNCHVTRNAERIDVVRAGMRWRVSAQAADLLKDLCVLKVPRLEGEAVRIGRASKLRPAQDVLAMGYTGGVGVQLSNGDVVALHPWSGSSIVQTTNWFSSGASGGGLFTADGSLVGILTFRLRGGATHYFSAPADWVEGLMDDEARYAPIGPLEGKSYWELAIDAQPYFLQAAALEQSRKWAALQTLCERWSREDPTDAEAVFLLGVAQDGLDHPDAAVRYFKRSLEIDPGYSRSWARLAHLYKRQGQLSQAREAVTKLAALDPKQARDIAAELDRP